MQLQTNILFLLNDKGTFVPALFANTAQTNSTTKGFSCFHLERQLYKEELYHPQLAVPCVAIISNVLPSPRC